VAIAFVICYALSNPIFFMVARPLMNPKHAVTDASGKDGKTAPDNASAQTAQAPSPQWVTQNPAEAFWVKLKLAGYAGVILAFPMIMYQLCGFVFPGLTATEKKAIRYLLGGCSVFAIFGVLVAYFGVFPLFLPYLVQWVPEGVQQQFRMNETVSLILMFLLGFAIAFQFPMVVLVLVYMELLTPAALKRYRRPAIVAQAIVAGVLTPPDPISMTIMLIPMIILYELSIWMSYLVIRRKRKEPSTA